MGMRKEAFMKELYHFERVTIPKEFVARKVEITLFLYYALRRNTPVMSGHARDNWRISSRVSHRGNEVGKRTQITRYTATTTARPRSELSIRASLSTVKPEQTIWVYNNVPYLESLADGHSLQAPKGTMIGIPIMETMEFIAARGW